MWCGGNELQTAADGTPGCGRPLDLDHPMLRRLGEVVAAEDPGRRYMPTSSSGTRFTAAAADYGKGLHWYVHGPWRLPEENLAVAQDYWQRDDALLRSETGAPGASPLDILEHYYGAENLLPVGLANVYWRRTSWWLEDEAYHRDRQMSVQSLGDYVDWSQQRQAQALLLAVSACKRRFPAIGGILWMGGTIVFRARRIRRLLISMAAPSRHRWR